MAITTTDETQIRVHWLDALRGIAILMMIMVHIFNTWAKVSISNSSSVPLFVYILGMAPAFFLGVVGMSMFLSLKNRGRSSYQLKRGIWLFIGGFSLGLATLQPQIFGIFQIIGISVILLYLLNPLDNSPIVFPIILFLFLLLTPIVNLLDPLTSSEYFFSITTPIAYTRPELISYSSNNLLSIFIENMLFAKVSYPIFPWISFPVLGYIMAKYLLTKKESINRVINSFVIGTLFVVASFLLMTIGLPIYKYPTTLNYVLLSVGIFIISTAIVKGIYDIHVSDQRNPITKAVETIGKDAFEIFILQFYVIAVGGAFISLEYTPLLFAMISSCIILLICP